MDSIKALCKRKEGHTCPRSSQVRPKRGAYVSPCVCLYKQRSIEVLQKRRSQQPPSLSSNPVSYPTPPLTIYSPQTWFFSLHPTMSSSSSIRRLPSAVSSSRTCSRVRLSSTPLTLRVPFLHAHDLNVFVYADVGESDQPIPLPNVSSSVLKKVRPH